MKHSIPSTNSLPSILTTTFWIGKVPRPDYIGNQV
jgi:hypothetical protein